MPVSSGSFGVARVGGLGRPAVSVIVTARNERHALPILLRALQAQTLQRHEFEVIVVDDGSKDETADIARASGARVFRSARHIGLAAGRNLGVRLARADYVVFTDADCVPDPAWLARGLSRLDDEDCDILTGGITIVLRRRPSMAALVDAVTHLDQERYIQRDFGAGANLWCRRSMFERHGGFDERLGMYGEEEEFCQRAVRGGATIVYDPAVHVVHPARNTRRLAQKAFLMGLGLATHRRLNGGTLGDYPRLFQQTRYYLPRRRIPGLHRLPTRPTIGQYIGMYITLHTCVIAPKILGDLVGEAMTARKRTSKFVDETRLE